MGHESWILGHGSTFVWVSGSWVTACDPLPALHINVVTLRRARLVLGWVTVSRFNSPCGTFISICDHPPRSTQPGHPFIGRRNEYRKAGE